jgi:catechol 2,3-dioxygenase-like lactoylglutathione lyase family enzyme
MEIGASLSSIELFVNNLAASAGFYERTFGFNTERRGNTVHCHAHDRLLVLLPGNAGQLYRANYRFRTVFGFEAQRRAMISRGVPLMFESVHGFSVQDTEGRLIGFLAPDSATDAPATQFRPARLQHIGVRSTAPAALVDFYVSTLGFVISDRVLDSDGDLSAAFLRTDSEHHSMAIFRSSETRFDHFSCETTGWPELRDWADHMADVGVDLAWGIGRHGPGNDTFLMIKDPDGNLAEVSSDLEQCSTDRPVGVWPHRPQTLNQWGVAIMRG